MNGLKNVKISMVFAGIVLFLALILRSLFMGGGYLKLLPIWLLIGFFIINIVFSCIPWLREKKSHKVIAQTISVGIAVVILCLL